ncbi:nucleotidyltransferase domain-containing protein, partial [Aeromonas hydrophila]
MTINSFVVVFGSVARGDSNKNSDLDILLIESDTDKTNSILEKQDLPNLPVNYVNYSHDLFKKYYDMGSLF